MIVTMRSFFFLFMASCSLVQVSLANNNLYDGDKHYVQTFDQYSSFDKNVLQGDGIWMIQFYSPTCPHCKDLVQDYKMLANVARGVFNIAAIDTSTEAGQRIASMYQVDSFPTMFLIGDSKKPVKYTGAHNVQDMFQEVMDFAVNTIRLRSGDPMGDPTAQQSGGGKSSSSGGGGGGPSKVVQLTSSNFEEQVLNNPMVSAIACEFSFEALGCCSVVVCLG
jgi:thiol-disulfide isomerase/thioredoxin